MKPKEHAGIGGNEAIPNPDQAETDKEQAGKGAKEQADRDKKKVPDTGKPVHKP